MIVKNLITGVETIAPDEIIEFRDETPTMPSFEERLTALEDVVTDMLLSELPL